MPNIQENFTQNQLDIISPSGQVAVAFDVNSGDYIRLTLLDENGNYDRQFFSNIDTTDNNGNLVPGTGDVDIDSGGKIYLN